jgi:hypothetical protein
MGAVTKLIKMALKESSEKLSKKYTGKTLTNILKSISKNKTGLEEQGIKVGPLKKKVASAKNKRKDFVIDQDAENRYGKVAQGATKDGKEVPLTLRKKGGSLKKGLKALPRTGKPSKPKKAAPMARPQPVLKKKKSGGMVGDGNQFVASFYKGDK